MKLESIDTKEAIIRFSLDEMIILNNAFNEVCNGLDIHEFSLRVGAEREEVAELLSAIGAIIDKINSK
jgi:hypothetical protein